jgi:hypothetical protein
VTSFHRAYAFAYSDFRAELLPLLETALATDDGAPLARFIDDHLDALTDPYEGEPLSKAWANSLESGDVQELGDFALTKYYDGDLDMGLDADWLAIKTALEDAGADPRLLLGTVLGSRARPFDPGGEGSYFQSEDEVVGAVETVTRAAEARPELEGVLAPLLGLLGQAARLRRGLYVTF